MKMSKFFIPLCAFYINLSTFAYMRSGGVLYIAFRQEYNCTYSQASWPVVAIGSFASFFIAIAGFLSHYFEKRSIIFSGISLSALSIFLSAQANSIELVIFLSALQGIGNGLFVGLLPMIIAERFEKATSIACGISYSGCTLAAFVFPPLLQILIDNYNLKTAVFILALVALSSALATWPLKGTTCDKDKKKTEINIINTTQHLINDLKVLKLAKFWQVTIIYVVFIYVFVSFLIVLPDLAVSRGKIDRHQAALLVSIFSIGDFLGRLLPGYFHFKNLVYNRTFYLYSMFAMSVLFLFIEFSVFCVFIGFATGIQMTLPTVVMTELIGVEQTVVGFGFANFLSGLIALSRPALIDSIKQITGFYDWLLVLNAALCLFSVLPWCIFTILKIS